MDMDEFKKVMADPFYAITVDPTFTMEHQPMLTKREWATLQAVNILKDEDGDAIPVEDLEQRIINHFVKVLDILDGTIVQKEQ